MNGFRYEGGPATGYRYEQTPEGYVYVHPPVKDEYVPFVIEASPGTANPFIGEQAQSWPDQNEGGQQ